MPGYPRENTIQVAQVSAAASPVTLKLPNASTGALPGGQSGVIKPISATQRWRIRHLTASYGGAAAPTTPGTLTITDGVFTWTFDVTVPLILPQIDIQCGAGMEVDVVLGSGGTGLIGHVNLSVISEG